LKDAIITSSLGAVRLCY